MRRLICLLFATSCGTHAEPPASREPSASNEMRCTLRISARGIYVDGDLMPRADAVAFCKKRAGAMVVLEDSAPQSV